MEVLSVIPSVPVYSELWQPKVFLGVPLAYILLVLYAKGRWMKEKPVSGLETYMIAYNIFQIAISTYSALLLYPVLFQGEGWWNIFSVNTASSERLKYGVYIYYLTKFLDLLDTLWIVLKRKNEQLSLLHVSHHGSIITVFGWLMWLGVGGTTVAFGPFINSVVHAFMYSHYLCMSLKIKNVFSKYLTSLQIFQFLISILHSVLVRFVDHSELLRNIAWVQFCYQCYMTLMFAHFFRKKYRPTKQE